MIEHFEEHLDSFVDAALREDVGSGDHTTLACIPAGSMSTAQLLVKDVGVIAGISVAEKIFKKVDPQSTFTLMIKDGSDVEEGDIAFEIRCHTHSLLKAERLVLNVMQRMSGIATMSSRFAVEVEGLPVVVLDTRKTTPLLRFLEKYAVRIGGCANYRYGLYDRIMIKDNHVEACGSIGKAVEQSKKYLSENNLDLEITVEVRNLQELSELLETDGYERIMFDNFEVPLLTEAVRIVDKRYETEASGGITLRNVRRIAETGVDYVSSGALTHSAGSLDLSLKIVK